MNEETHTHIQNKPKKREIKSIAIKKETREYLEQNVMTAAYLIDNAPQWRERILEQGKVLSEQKHKIDELEASNHRLMRENISLLRFKNNILEEKFGTKGQTQ